MNYLAHVYLSGEHKMITIGNFMADGIKGKSYQNYPKALQIGILLHREIDTFTDAHPTFRKSTKRLHEKYGHYSGIIVDILYDHFLAKNWDNYCETPLAEYVDGFYDALEDNFEILPQRIQQMLPYMISGNWLLSYASIEGIGKVLEGMNRRTKNRSQMNLAIEDLKTFYEEFETEFTSFFKELIAFSQEKLKTLSSQLNFEH
jgi:acyl carrier protein phosphodiesterase